jgi:hypothetical protein
LLISSRSINKHGHYRQFLFLIGRFLKIFYSETAWSMDRNVVGSIYGRSSIRIVHSVLIHQQTWPPQIILVSDWPISKNLLLWNCFAKWTVIWWKAPTEGSVLRFLKAEWKVSDTGSAHWVSSSFILHLAYNHF